ncbi:aa3-type cytochrome c oxidase subunit IV [Ketogulonicigenium vulgare]|uniref:Cytochrome c oxidase subunit IV bacterial aa3 type domain-containing protein n=1 Tax=Ketogulonicigenium vulgare (strain WSH-001) TaxID=759362 RepID=F9Y8G1_KETVW|nr:aa3-type cytochrome c oxidase subunit IV [Ketogulonicigenium vulgare]ADO41735.1 hypothetical protein EIO_0573 [Ketogulonicigenium vulgare Y25]AEM39970.1 hypothetical protein KVU_0131 [Ketogulonicigenium vulgare WSH-001]ALJ80177.1 hypothetical protein KVH_02700 [Ketogulonicigenium vulgare]ANW34891.1 hypothetical protein KvSKV_02695 [Ketogulonicigenium vulgare]AOZ53666.1 hypothetical protein KVC_0642 [Ketogulonicigenium vulgare]
MAEYKHGSMDITEQQQTYKGFVKAMVIGGVIAAVLAVLGAIFL